MSMIKPDYRTIQQLLQSQSFSIDEYQREYKWDKDNVDELLGDLLDKFSGCYKEGDETSAVPGYDDYFLGSIIVSKRNGKNYLIDGQQRVTTLTLLLIYLYHAAKCRNLSVASGLEPLIYSDNYGNPSFNLAIPERLPVIKALFQNQPYAPDGKEESIQIMYARYQDIEARDLAGELGDALPHFIYWLMGKVGLIEIATDNDKYAYAIFETMNDRGKPLSGVDMLKAYLLAPVEDSEQRRTANQVWKQNVLNLITAMGTPDEERDDNCIKAWLRAQYALSIRERKANSTDMDWELIGSEFHRWTRDNEKRLGLGKAPANLAFISNDFPFFARAYQRILSAGRQYTKGLEAVFYNAHNEFTWQNTVLLAPLTVGDDDETVRRKLLATATYLDIWLMRRTVNYVRVGYSSTSYAMYNLCNEIRRKPLLELVEILGNKLASDEVTFDGYPSRDRDGINDLYLNQFTGRYIYHLLARLNAFVELQSGGSDLFPEYVNRNVKNPFDMEHICANHYSRYTAEFASAGEFQHWRNHVAGLLLVRADVNRSLNDKPFVEKVPVYAKQDLYTASLSPDAAQNQPQFRAFQERYCLPFKTYTTHFGKQEQEERRQLVYALVNLVWSPNRLQEVLA